MVIFFFLKTPCRKGKSVQRFTELEHVFYFFHPIHRNELLELGRFFLPEAGTMRKNINSRKLGTVNCIFSFYLFLKICRYIRSSDMGGPS